MSASLNTFELPIRVYIEDTDAGGIVYHVNYLKYMERARTEFLRALGVEQRDTLKQDTAYVVHSLSTRYHTPARIDDELTVTCAVKELRGASVLFGQEVRDRRTGVVQCSAEVKVVCVSATTMKPKALPAGTFRQAG